MSVPHAVMAAGWIPFVVVFLLSFVFASGYILWFRSTSREERSSFATLVSIVSLTATLVTSTLVPVDVFLVSFMKHSNGTYKEWADDPKVRSELESTVLHAYYAFYAIILCFAFFFLPLVFFFHVGRESPGQEETFRSRMCRSVKYTALVIFAFALLVTIGIFVPFKSDVDPPNHNLTYWQEFDYMFEEFKRERGENLVVFLMNVLSLIGMTLLVFYTGYGMSSLPINMIRGQRSVYTERENVQAEILDIQNQIKTLQEEFSGRNTQAPHFETMQLERLEQRLRLLQRTDRDLEQNTRSFMNRVILCCRPFQLLVGIVFGFVGLLIFVSLTLTSVDKAMHSLGPMHGYVLQNGTLPNPVDIVFVFAQDVFPLDYILYSCMILFFIFCSMSGIKNLGIRCLCLPMYRIEPGKTKPQTLIMMCFTLIFILLAMNVLLFSVVPDYTTYGSQHFLSNVTIGNVTKHVTEKCDKIEAPENECNMSRIAFLLLAFHSEAWIFGALYYWMIWAFLATVVIGSFVAIYRARRYQLVGVEEDQDELLDDSNPFH